MPQLWLTYQEVADELECDAAEARATSIECGWTRKHSRDGLTRVSMPPEMMQAYFVGAALRAADAKTLTDTMVRQLRSVIEDIAKARPKQDTFTGLHGSAASGTA